jgi:hypothetical protein
VTTCSAATGSPRKFNLENDTNCLMRVQAGTLLQDPPLTDRGISLKPVDFIPDPERRAHGFRLRTASGNPADFSGTNLARKVGMTLVTDNSVYIMGDFNLHSTTGQKPGTIEEFEDTPLLKDVALGDGYVTEFYDRAALNTDTFANLSQDHWRPVEILSDAMSILSIDFRDGALVDGFIEDRPPGEGEATSSYMNQNRPITPIQAVVREDGTGTGLTPAPDDLPSPVYLNRNGTYFVVPPPPAATTPSPFYDQYTTASGNWTNFAATGGVRRRNLQTANPDGTVVNAVFVSGIVPNRPRQVYGGLHNYPRFLEYWRQGTTPVDVTIAGAFIQLNFSTASTAPYEQVAWESGQNPSDFPNINAFIEYYQPPNRRWGYDVGLLYVPPAPAARRFVTFGAPRSEYYRELPADDPYVVNLRCAKNANGDLVFPDNNVCPS